jgi:hypothetical protein
MIGVGWLMVANSFNPLSSRVARRFLVHGVGGDHLGFELLLSSASGKLVLRALKAQGLVTSDEGQNVNLDSSLRKVTNINYKF